MRTNYETITVRKDNEVYWTIKYNNLDNVYTTGWVLWDNTYETVTDLFRWLVGHWIEIDMHIFW